MTNQTSALFKKWLATSTPRQKWTAGLLVFSLLATGLFFMQDNAAASPSDPLSSSPLYFAGVILKLIGVLLLIVGGAALARRWLRLGPQGSHLHHLRVLETVRLSPRQALHLVAIGDQQILIGATDQAIALITQLEASEMPAAVETPQSQPALDFGALLQSIKG